MDNYSIIQAISPYLVLQELGCLARVSLTANSALWSPECWAHTAEEILGIHGRFLKMLSKYPGLTAPYINAIAPAAMRDANHPYVSVRAGKPSRVMKSLARYNGVLERVRALRKTPGVAGGLYHLGRLMPRYYDSVLPAIRPDKKYQRKLRSRAKAIDAIEYKADWLQRFDLKAHGLVIAGGAVCGAISGLPSDDVDLFFVGVDEARAREVLLILANCIDQYREGMVIARSRFAVSFTAKGMSKVQVVLRLYQTAADVLHGFDIGAACALYDGEHIWLNELGKLAHEEKVILLDLSVRRLSYEYRLRKYISRGFTLVLPGLREDCMPMIGPLKGKWLKWRMLDAFDPDQEYYYNRYYDTDEMLAREETCAIRRFARAIEAGRTFEQSAFAIEWVYQGLGVPWPDRPTFTFHAANTALGDPILAAQALAAAERMSYPISFDANNVLPLFPVSEDEWYGITPAADAPLVSYRAVKKPALGILP